MKKASLFLTRIIYIVLIFSLVFTLIACSSTTNKSNAIIKINIDEQSTGKTVFTFNQDQPDKTVVDFPKNLNKLRAKNPYEFIRQLALYLKKDVNDDFQLVKRAHDWVALNIKYDDKSFLSHNIPYQGYDNVLVTGLAVCAGYAELFKKICDELKIECDIVSGYSRGYGFSLSGKEDIATNHAWNKVKIYNNWYLVDCTWDSGYLKGTKQVQEYRTDYLFIKPERMIFDHYPDLQYNQLLEKPVKQDEFLNMAQLKPKFFINIKEVKPNLGKMTKIEGNSKIIFYINENSFVNFHILFNNEYIDDKNNFFKMIRYKDRYEINFTVFEKGEYVLRLFAFEQQTRTYQWIADYGLNVISVYKPPAKEDKPYDINESLRKEILKFK